MSVVERKLTDEEEAEVEAIRDALRLLPYDAETDAMRSRAFEALGFLTGTIKGLSRRIEYMARRVGLREEARRARMTDVRPRPEPPHVSHTVSLSGWRAGGGDGVSDNLVEPNRDEAIRKLEALFKRLLADGRLTDCGDVSYALALLKEERGDYDDA